MTFHTLGIVLAVRNSGEDDRRAIIYTGEHGKLELAVKSARRIGSKLSPHLEPLTLVDCYVVRGRRDHLAGIERCDRFPFLRTSLPRLTTAAWAAELVDVLTKPDHPDPRIFSLLGSWFSFLEEHQMSRGAPERLRLAYLVTLLNYLGYRPECASCVRCKGEQSPAWYFSARDGGVVCETCPRENSLLPIGESMRSALHAFVTSAPDFRIEAHRSVPEDSARDIINMLLAEHLSYPLAADLFSARLLKRTVPVAG